ncbi:MAG: radical SAM protein [Deltaproteobacteria bacterium]|nr:radical SAM protein [Deltaproteobacteria bacterium]
MESFCIDGLQIALKKQGADEYTKVSYPLRYGLFSEIVSPDFIFQLNLNGEIKFITGRGKAWPDPSEYLKRTIDNNWIYYSTGGYSGVYDSFGEYYLPCPSYPSNSIQLDDPFQTHPVQSAINAWHETYSRLSFLARGKGLPKTLVDFLGDAVKKSPEFLEERSFALMDILGDRVTVLPPDTRHVDYDVIPVFIADGCLYKCDFCMIKSQKKFACRSKDEILHQINELRHFYNKDICNYNAIFLAQHDALNAGGDLIEYAARYAYDTFGLRRSALKGAYLFLFGSAHSLLTADDTLFDQLEALPYLTYINIGLESADAETLHLLKKAITPQTVHDAFKKMLDINKRYRKIEVTSNFVFGNHLPKGHLPSVFRLMEKQLKHFYAKGAVYFSPFMNGTPLEKRGTKREFYKIKMRSRLPTYLYLIQRL